MRDHAAPQEPEERINGAAPVMNRIGGLSIRRASTNLDFPLAGCLIAVKPLRPDLISRRVRQSGGKRDYA
jgi:hypothetical protein